MIRLGTLTAIVLYRQGKGGLVYYNKDITDYNNIPPKKRLWNEVNKGCRHIYEIR